MAADVVVTLVSVVPVVLGASLDVCGVAVTAAVTLELTVIVSLIGVISLLDKLVTVGETFPKTIVPEVLVVRVVMLFDPPAAVARVVENIKEKILTILKI